MFSLSQPEFSHNMVSVYILRDGEKIGYTIRSIKNTEGKYVRHVLFDTIKQQTICSTFTTLGQAMEQSLLAMERLVQK